MTISWNHLTPDHFKGNSFNKEDFTNRSLVGFDFSGSILHRCDFSGSDLSHTNFTGADLYRSKFCKAILYTTYFNNTNLTRVDLRNAYIYGFQATGFSNITFAKFDDFKIESYRRGSEKILHFESTKNYSFGEKLECKTKKLCETTYCAGGYKFKFSSSKIDTEEEHMQKSQIYNRLKRLYRKNAYGNYALHCSYKEKYHLRKSHHKYDAFTGEKVTDSIGLVIKTIWSYLSEKIAGYGIKPFKIISNMMFLILMFTIFSFFICIYCEKSGIIYKSGAIEEHIDNTSGEKKLQIMNKYIELGKESKWQIGKIFSFSFSSFFSWTSNNYIPYGILQFSTMVFSLAGKALLGILVASIFFILTQD